jgi:hypothetical protein
VHRLKLLYHKKHNIKPQVDVPYGSESWPVTFLRIRIWEILCSGNGNRWLRIEKGSSASGLETKIGTVRAWVTWTVGPESEKFGEFEGLGMGWEAWD